MIYNMSSAKQQGFSLVELLVSMTLGAFIIAGLVSVFISASSSYRMQQALVEVQDKGRFSIEKLREGIQLAGLGLADTDVPVRVVAVGGATDCDNSSDAVLEIYFNEDNAALDSLMCFHFDQVANQLQRNLTIVGTAVVAGNEVIIIDSVDQINFLFAVDVDGNGVDVIGGEVYQTAAALDAASAPNWVDVVAVRIELIVASNTGQVLESAQSLANPFDSTPAVSFNANVDDTRLHQAYTALVSLRNRML